MLESVRRGLVGAIEFYQRVISPLKSPSCRFYPSCSEYARWLFSYSNLAGAFLSSLWRILRCHPFSRGGIDYPVIFKKLTPIFAPPRAIRVWFVPLKPRREWRGWGRFYLIKSIQ